MLRASLIKHLTGFSHRELAFYLVDSSTYRTPYLTGWLYPSFQ